MQGWQISKAGTIEKVNRIESLTDIDCVKLRITKSLITSEDIVTYLGEDKKVKFPIIPCMAAIGQINELPIDNPYFEKGTRVYVSSVKNCGNCPRCVIDKPEDCYNFVIAGKTTDGFLKDFAVANTSDIYALPQSIRDEDAIFIEFIKLALSAIDSLGLEKGQHVAIIGATMLGVILSQLIIYYQGVPILIDSSEEKLELAKNSGVYYTINTNSNVEKEVASLTGGRMSSQVIHVSRSGIPFDLAIKVAAPTANVVFVGFSYPDVRMSLRGMLDKRIKMFAVSTGFGNSESAINMLANKAIDLSNYNIPITKLSNLESNFEKMSEEYKQTKSVMPIIVNMVD